MSNPAPKITAFYSAAANRCDVVIVATLGWHQSWRRYQAHEKGALAFLQSIFPQSEPKETRSTMSNPTPDTAAFRDAASNTCNVVYSTNPSGIRMAWCRWQARSHWTPRLFPLFPQPAAWLTVEQQLVRLAELGYPAAADAVREGADLNDVVYDIQGTRETGDFESEEEADRVIAEATRIAWMVLS